MRRVVTSKSVTVYNAQHCCPFDCDRLYINFLQHILGKTHETEPEIIQINRIALTPADSATDKLQKLRKRKELIAVLRNRGDHNHNKEVLLQKRGEMIVARRKTENDGSFLIADYGPCPLCFEWLKLETIPRHQTNCILNNDNTNQTRGT